LFVRHSTIIKPANSSTEVQGVINGASHIVREVA
jgi:hypothetical protein